MARRSATQARAHANAASPRLPCPACRSTRVHQAGSVRSGALAYHCIDCGRYFSDTTDPRWGGKARVQAAASHARAKPITGYRPSIRDELETYLLSRSNLPPVPERIRATRVKDMGFDTPQETCAVFSDYHYGAKIDKRAASGLAEYNPDIARVRLARWRDGLLRFTQADQTLLNIDKLHLLALGDDLEGHGRMFHSQALQMDMSLGFQVVDFVEDLCTILPEFLTRYSKVRVYKVRGNHGRIANSAKEDYPPDSAELFAWQMIAERLTGRLGGTRHVSDTGIQCYEGGPIEFFISPGWVMFLDVLGWKLAIRHGHGIKGIDSTYTGALSTKLRMNSLAGEVINYLIKGHLHEPQNAESEIRGEVLQNGCFTGPSLLSLEMARAVANLPSQEMFLLHPRRGITSRHRITLAEVGEVRQLEWVGRGQG